MESGINNVNIDREMTELGREYTSFQVCIKKDGQLLQGAFRT